MIPSPGVVPCALCGSPLSGTGARSATNRRLPSGDASTRSGAWSSLTYAGQWHRVHPPARFEPAHLRDVGVAIERPQIPIVICGDHAVRVGRAASSTTARRGTGVFGPFFDDKPLAAGSDTRRTHRASGDADPSRRRSPGLPPELMSIFPATSRPPHPFPRTVSLRNAPTIVIGRTWRNGRAMPPSAAASARGFLQVWEGQPAPPLRLARDAR